MKNVNLGLLKKKISEGKKFVLNQVAPIILAVTVVAGAGMVKAEAANVSFDNITITDMDNQYANEGEYVSNYITERN